MATISTGRAWSAGRATEPGDGRVEAGADGDADVEGDETGEVIVASSASTRPDVREPDV
jgi:hypothetical protein